MIILIEAGFLSRLFFFFQPIKGN